MVQNQQAAPNRSEAVELDAHEAPWQVAAVSRSQGYGLNAQIAGPKTRRPGSRPCIARMPDDRPGSWMYHCHTLEHHAARMIAHFDVSR